MSDTSPQISAPDAQTQSAPPDNVTAPSPQGAPPAPPAPNAAPAQSVPVPAPNSDAATQSQLSDLVAQQRVTAAKIKELSQPAPVVPQKHSTLFSIISAIGEGLSSSARALQSGGREGGAPEVLAMEGEKQRQAQSAQAAIQSQRDAALGQQLTVFDTTQKLMSSVQLAATFHNTQTKDEFDMAKGEADFRSSHGGNSPVELNKMLSDTTPASGQQGGANSFITTGAKQTLDAAMTAGMKDDPYVQMLRTELASPTATNRSIYQATQNLQSQQDRQSKAITEKSARSEAQTRTQAAAMAGPADAGDLNAFLTTTLPGYGLDKPLAAGLIAEANRTGLTQEQLDKLEDKALNLKQLEVSKTVAQINAKGLKEQGLDAATSKDTRDRLDDLSTKGTKNYYRSAALNNDFRSTIAAAKTGDQTAAAFARTMGIQDVNDVAGLSRIPPTEYEAQGSAGSLYRQASNAIAKAGSGTLSPETLTELGDLADRIREAQYGGYLAASEQIVLNSGTKDLSKIYVLSPDGLNSVPLSEALKLKNDSGSATGHKVGDVRVQNGKNFVVTSVDANGRITGAREK